MVHAIYEIQKVEHHIYEPIIKITKVGRKETKNVSRKLDE